MLLKEDDKHGVFAADKHLHVGMQSQSTAWQILSVVIFFLMCLNDIFLPFFPAPLPPALLAVSLEIKISSENKRSI